MVLYRKYVERLPMQREKLLKVVYEISEGDPNTFVSLKEIIRSIPSGGEGGIDFIRTLASYWIDKDFLHALGNKRLAVKVRITGKGIDYIEPKLLEGQDLS